MSAPFQFELVSPEKLLASKSVIMVTVPGGEGDYGVLAGHAPLITTVRPGVLEIYADNENTVTERIFVAGGFAEVTNERCTVLAEEAMPVDNLDRRKIEESLRDLLDDMTMAENDHERAAIEKQLTLMRAQLEAVA